MRETAAWALAEGEQWGTGNDALSELAE